jgi:hypothetical protein
MILMFLFLALLGRFGSNLAFGLLLSIHATGLSLLLEPWLPGLEFRGRAALTLALLLALGGLLYGPARTVLEKRFFAPVRAHDQVVIIQKFGAPPRIQRGDWIAYSLPEGGSHNAYFQAGLGFGPVLGVPGDRIRFSKTFFEVNGVRRTRLLWMPESGELVTPEKHWFVWPEVNISGHGLVAESDITATLLQMATISEEQFEGKPFKRWFWYRQYAP